ncbi:MAG: hypothetical protein WCK88_02835 [bacterium]
MVDQTKSLVQADYTTESWTALSLALELPETSNTLVITKTSAINLALG